MNRARAIHLERSGEPPHVTAARRRIFAAAFVGAIVVGALAGVLGSKGGL